MTSRGGDRFEFWAAALTAAVTLLTFILAATTLPRSGPFCVDGCVGYPYTSIAAYIPRDFLWMYPALLVAPLLRSRQGRRPFRRAHRPDPRAGVARPPAIQPDRNCFCPDGGGSVE